MAINVVVPTDEIQLDDKLHMIEEPVEIVDREVRRLKQSRIPIVKVRWNSQRGPEFTWEREDQIKKRELAKSTSIDEQRTQQRRKRDKLTTMVARLNMLSGEEYQRASSEDPTVQVITHQQESANETDDVDDSDRDLSYDNPDGNDDDAGFGVFMYNKSTETPKSTYCSLTITSSSLDFIQNLLEETPVNELMDLISNPVYTDAHTVEICTYIK
ncbi:hypothetical protein Tco_0832481 [Tanacetum coccineum]